MDGGSPDGGVMVLVRTTVATEAQATDLARRLVEPGLAACVHVQEVQSTYRWKGALKREAEFLVEARTLESRFGSVRKAMLDGHPYELPLIERLEANGIPSAYLDWARQG